MTTSRLLPTPTSINRERSPETMKKCADFRKKNANQDTVPLYLGEVIAGNNLYQLPPTNSDQLPLFSPEAFPASPFPVPGNEKARKMTVTSGLKCLESYQKQGPLGLLAKMLVGSSTWDSMNVFLIWKLKATKCNHLLYQLAPKTPRTDGTGCGLLHTPAQQEPGVTVERLQTKKGTPAKVGERAYDKETGRLAQVGLVQQIAMLPTPIAGDWKGQKRKDGTAGMLSGKIALIPTPATRDYKGANGAKHMEKDRPHMDQLPNVVAHGTNRGLKLQPAFVEWMQGYPDGWTDLKV